MPADNSPSGDKEGTDTDEPTREQIDLLFATLIDGMDRHSSGMKSEAMIEMVGAIWNSARKLEESGDYAPESGTVDEIAEEWL